MLVVFIHCEYPYKADVLPVTDVAVPLFFAISGYFVFGVKRKYERIERIVKIFVWSAALYLLKTEALHFLSIHQFWFPTFKNITDFLLFNDVAFSIHLWYLPAYIYVLLIAFYIDKYNIWRRAMCFIIPLLLVGAFIKCQIVDICPQNIQYFRNAYFNGLPYFLLGAFVKLTPPITKNNTKKMLAIILCLLIVALFIIRYNLTGDCYGQLALKEMNLMFLTFCIMFLVTLVVQKKDDILSALGRNYSLYIYIFHLLIIQICEMGVTKLPEQIGSLYMYINPLVVLMLSIAFTYLLGKLKILRV